ncbi:hypothetical protein PWT90_00953 [Aphanocladium album]|nr:hypothetical protein PWT90_00953 [Aphanocladium album]
MHRSLRLWPFDQDTNLTGILLDGSLSKARGGKGNANGDAPVYFDGALLSNDAEFFLYGGAVFQDKDLFDSPTGNEILEYQAYAYGPDKTLWKPGFNTRWLPDGVTRYIAYGGAASASSENKAWYFSGLTAPDRGPFYWNAAKSSDVQASVPSDTLITLDMKSQLSEKWTNSTLPSNIKARANPELIWAPIGEKGILIVLGGVVHPEWATPLHVSLNETLSERDSPVFMSTIDIYDITNNTWYQQPTTGGPGTRTRGCAVVAPAADRSSFNIYYYGGFDGIHTAGAFFDEVWVLSLPSFTWTKISEGRPSHARAGHKCFLPYPDQMMVVGGYTSQAHATCLEDGPVILFNITSGEWMSKYDPALYGKYGVHEKVQTTIGGNSSGHATLASPASGWATPALEAVFATSYDFGKMKEYWPYMPSTTNKTEFPGPPPLDPDNHKGVPSWIAPVLGVVLSLVVLTGGTLAFCIRRRRRASRSGADTLSSHQATSERLFCWAKRHSQHKSPVTFTSSGGESDLERPSIQNAPTTSGIVVNTALCQEMGDTQIVELGGKPRITAIRAGRCSLLSLTLDTSSPVELPGTGLTTADAVRRSAGFAPLMTNLSSFTSLRSASGDSPVPVSSTSGSEGTPSTPYHSSRWTRKMSDISAVSHESGDAVAYSPSSIVSPIAPTLTPTEEHAGGDDSMAAGTSPLRNVVSKDDFR